MKKYFKFLIGGLFFACLLCQSVFALVVVNFDSDIAAIGQIQYYWNGDDFSPAVTTPVRVISSSPTSGLSVSGPAKALLSLPTKRFAFYSDAAPASVASQVAYIRAWNPAHTLYTQLQRFENGPQALNFKTFNNNDYAFVGGTTAVPDKATIIGYREERGAGGAVTKVTFFSTQPSRVVDGHTVAVEVRRSHWTVAHGGSTTTPPVLPGAVYTLEATPSAPITGSYTLTVAHDGYFSDTTGAVSNPYIYTPGSGGTSTGGTLSVTYNFVHPAGDLAINPIIYPFDPTTAHATPSGLVVSTVKNLVDAINAANPGTSGGRVVNAVGWWDVEHQVPAGYVITYPVGGGTTPTFIPAGHPSAFPSLSGAQPLVKDNSYQISVSGAASLTVSGSR